MATRTVSLQTILEFIADAGLPPECAIDTDESPGPFSLTGWDEKLTGTVKLGASATDQVLAFTNAIMVLLVSDKPFSLRHASAETLLGNLRLYVVMADDTLDGIMATSVLLTGNSVDQAIIQYYIVEKP